MNRRDELRRNGTHTHTTARAALRGGHTVTTRGDADHNPRDESQPVSDEHVAADMSAPFVMMNREPPDDHDRLRNQRWAGHPGRRADARNQTPATDRGCQVVGAHPRCYVHHQAADHGLQSQIDGESMARTRAATCRPGLRGIVEQQGRRPAQPCTYCLRSLSMKLAHRWRTADDERCRGPRVQTLRRGKR